MKKILILLILVLPLFSCKTQRINSFIGSQILNMHFNELNCDFLVEHIESKSLLKMVNQNAYSQKEKININSLLKKTDILYVSIGEYDLLKNVSLIDKELVVSENQSLIELFSLNLVNIIEEILLINSKIRINIISLYNPYVNDFSDFYRSFNLLVNDYNKEIKNICLENYCNYIDISSISEKIVSFNTIKECDFHFVEELLSSYE